MVSRFEKDSPARFIVVFLALFFIFYYFNIFFFGITLPGNHYNAFLAENLDYISGLRHLLIACAAQLINWFGYQTLTNEYQLLVVGHGHIIVVYTCLGLGVMSFFAAFVLAYPKKLKSKLIFLISGLLTIQLLNVIRLAVVAFFRERHKGQLLDHHTIFNFTIYLLIAISIYFWSRHDDK